MRSRWNKDTGKWEEVEGSLDLNGAEFPGGQVYAGVVSPNDGYVFKSKRDHYEYMKRNGFRIAE